MIIEKNTLKYIIHAEDNIINALKKISENKSGFIFSVTETGILEGVLTDGDIRRWIVEQEKNIDFNQPVSLISNKQFFYVRSEEPIEKIEASFSERVQFIPVLDSQDHLVAIARQESTEIIIDDFVISENSPTFIIAEIGNNHNGNLESAKKLVDYAVEAGANCAKFQMRNMEKLYANKGNAQDASEDLGSQYTLDLLSRFQLSNEELFEVFDYCKSKGIIPLCTPWDIESLKLLEEYGMSAYKLASADLTNHDLLIEMIKTGKPLICSTGMSTEQEILEAVHLLKKKGGQYILLHCNSTYPSPFKDINLVYMEKLKEIGKCFVGYSGHERGSHVTVAAVARGAKVIEKHFTLDKTLEGNDHKVSLLPEEFARMVKHIREVEQALGELSSRIMSQGELINRETLAKSLVINQDLSKGQIITKDMIGIRSPGRGLQPNRKKDVIGKIAKRNFKAGDFFYLSDVMDDCIEARKYKMKRAWGVPVRYHDFKKILEKTNPDLLEFHLSYKDMDENISSYFGEKVYNLDLIVHSPELFAGDHILDLCSLNEKYRRHSVKELQRVIDITRQIKPFFSKAYKPLIVTNMGGFTEDSPLSTSERSKYYSVLLQSLSELDTEGIEIIPQTMPPFPWHFGGQRYHNLFVSPDEIREFCSNYGYRICLDISHSKLACNYHKYSFSNFLEKVGPYTAHLHIVDAKGVDGEGLQIGEGDIDFKELSKILDQYASKASFIPEIWQGHKNDGEGFWVALNSLEKYL